LRDIKETCRDGRKIMSAEKNELFFSDFDDTSPHYIKACNTSGCSPKSNTAIVPYAPINLNAAALTTAGKIKLTWTDKSSNETGFKIYPKSGACVDGETGDLVATVGANVKSWTDSGLTTGGVYSYKILAYRRSAAPYANGYSQETSCVSATSP
jgi:hypothetical protein